MNDDREELTIFICKIGSPIILFICLPTFIWILYSITKKGVDAGAELKVNPDLVNALLVIPIVVAGVWMGRKGYGWFGGSK